MGKPTGFTVHLLRVGETKWDADERIIGRTDLPMTDHGSNQVVAAVQRFQSDQPISLVLSSNEESAQQAAKLISVSADSKYKTLDGLANIGMGLWEGTLHKVLQDRYPSAYNQWIESPERITPPEGESFSDAQERLLMTIAKSVSKVKGTHPSLILVLRPWAWAIVRCWLNDLSLNQVWAQVTLPIEVETTEMSMSKLENFLQTTQSA